MLRMFRNEKGFTLIELMVVVLIIGILIAIAIPLYNVATARAETRTCQANLRTIEGAINTYRASTDAYPGDIATMVTAGYLKRTPECPTADAGYSFTAGSPPVVVCPVVGANPEHSID